MSGYINLVLHAHLPFVRHPEFEDFLEEDWFYEACLETYMPLLSMFERLYNDNVPFKLTMSITPTLAAMMKDAYLMGKLERKIYKLKELIGKEKKRKINTPFYESILMYEKWIHTNQEVLEKYDFDLTKGFKRFYKSGCSLLVSHSLYKRAKSSIGFTFGRLF
jgi:1,4-alpha-glucan branching enzyme